MGEWISYLSSVKDFDKTILNLDGRKGFQMNNYEIISRYWTDKTNWDFKYNKYRKSKNVKIQGDFGWYQYSGTDIRKRLNLKSTFVRFELIEDNETESDNENSKKLSTSIVEDKPITYLVKEGDNLSDIAYRYNVSLSELVTVNSIKDPTLININQILLIPRNQVKNVSSTNKTLVVSGYGSGHGVGMSQWGAKYMATKGATAEEILKHFYKGVKIKPFKRYFL